MKFFFEKVILLTTMTKLITYSALALSIFAGASMLSSCSKSDAENAAPKTFDVFSVKTSTVEMAPMAASFRATGTLEGIREANVNSETQGRILQVSVNNGSRVGQGSALVIVDNELK